MKVKVCTLGADIRRHRSGPGVDIAGGDARMARRVMQVERYEWMSGGIGKGRAGKRGAAERGVARRDIAGESGDARRSEEVYDERSRRYYE